MNSSEQVWLEILSELFVNFAAVWLGTVIIEPLYGNIRDPLLLIFRFILGMLSLYIAKYLRQKSKNL